MTHGTTSEDLAGVAMAKEICASADAVQGFELVPVLPQDVGALLLIEGDLPLVVAAMALSLVSSHGDGDDDDV